MFTEEMAREIGIAYGLYAIRCKEKGIMPLDVPEFVQIATDSIEKVRQCKGLKDEADVCG